MINTFSTNLRIARKNKSLTQEALATAINSTKATISNYETGYSEPSIEILIKLSEKLEVTIDFLCGNKPVSANEVSKESLLYELETAKIQNKLQANRILELENTIKKVNFTVANDVFAVLSHIISKEKENESTS